MHSDPNSQWDLRGPECLDDLSLLSFLLTRGGAPGPGALQVAGHVLEALGGLPGLMSACEAELCSVRGIGPSRARKLVALTQLARRAIEEPLRPGEVCSDPERVHRFVRGRLGHQRTESLWVLLLDDHARLIRQLEVARGRRNAVSVTPSDIFEPALRAGAAQVILVHNHPSGEIEPSRLDRALTERLVAAGDLLGIRVTDHLVVSLCNYSSLAELGLMGASIPGFLPEPASSQYTAGEVTPLDSVYDRALPHGVSNAKQGVAEEQNNLEDEETVWQLPEQLSIPFLRQLELPLESKKECSPTWDDGLSAGQASQDTKPRPLRNDEIAARGRARGASQESCGSGPLRP